MSTIAFSLFDTFPTTRVTKLRVLLDDIEWDVPEGTDITALPVIDLVDIDLAGIDDQDDFWERIEEVLEEKYKVDLFGCSYHILEGTVH